MLIINFALSKLFVFLPDKGINIPVAIYGTITPSSFQMIDLIMLVFSAILLFLFSRTFKRITRFEGAFMLLLFVVYYTLVFVL